MTEYDYSPAAYEKYLQTQQRIGKWVDETLRVGAVANPFLPSEEDEDEDGERRAFYRDDGGGGGGDYFSSRHHRSHGHGYTHRSYSTPPGAYGQHPPDLSRGLGPGHEHASSSSRNSSRHRNRDRDRDRDRHHHHHHSQAGVYSPPAYPIYAPQAAAGLPGPMPYGATYQQQPYGPTVTSPLSYGVISPPGAYASGATTPYGSASGATSPYGNTPTPYAPAPISPPYVSGATTPASTPYGSPYGSPTYGATPTQQQPMVIPINGGQGGWVFVPPPVGGKGGGVEVRSPPASQVAYPYQSFTNHPQSQPHLPAQTQQQPLLKRLFYPTSSSGGEKRSRNDRRTKSSGGGIGIFGRL